MPRSATGNVLLSKGSYYARVTIAPRTRRAFRMPSIRSEEAARVRADVLAELAAQLRKAGAPRELVPKLIEAGAEARTRAELDEVRDTVRRVCAGELRPRPTNATTFRELGEMWTRGDLAERWPDHVKRKKAKDGAETDRQRLEKHVYPLVGDVRLADFTLEHAEIVMRSLPSSLEPATRRHYAQLVRRVLSLAVYPARIIDASPIPRGWLPKLGAPKALAFLYPDEDALLLRCAAVPLCYRVLYGFAPREGMRKGELERLAWNELDLERGALRLDENKTDDPRAWALDPGVVRAMRAWYELRGRPDGRALVFVDEAGEPIRMSHLAEAFREHLQLAGVARAELFIRSKNRLPIRVHDLRATFVTIALATGRSEAWVAARTGHQSSTMINRYRRAAKTIEELGMRELAPLDAAIPELAALAAEKAPEKAPEAGGGGQGDGSETRRDPKDLGALRKRGLEPPRPFGHWNLNPARLPVPPLPRGGSMYADRGGVSSSRQAGEGGPKSFRTSASCAGIRAAGRLPKR